MTMRSAWWLGLAGLAALAAGAASLEGRWSGAAAIPGRELAIVIDLERDASGAWAGSLIVPGFDVKGAPLQNVVVRGDELRCDAGEALASAPSGPATFVARLGEDGRLRGELTQAGNVAPLMLARTGAPQVERPRRSAAVATGTEGRWIGEFELGGYPRQVTLDIANRGSAAPQVEFVVVGKATTKLPVDFIAEDDGVLRIESRAYRIAFEGRVAGGRIEGSIEVGPQEIPLRFRRPAEKSS
jgi:hypothetical protein